MRTIPPDPVYMARKIFGKELLRQRAAKGWTQHGVGSRLGVHQSLISQWERAIKTPGPGYAERLDEIFGLTDESVFATHYHRIVRAIDDRTWTMRWAEDVERQAVTIKFWDPLLVTGLLQTRDYAYAIYRGAGQGSKWAEERLAERLARKDILEKDKPPSVLSLIDEAVLDRPIGGPQSLRNQLEYLVEMTERPNVTIQVVPLSAACTRGLTCAFGLATLPLDPDVATVDSLVGPFVTVDFDIVSKLHIQFDTIRADAYPQSQSISLIKNAIQRWKK
ncbi:helix-turn-helix domain-containing protein [Spongiactinospora sp. 9N601]|uniref:helix-turn-helix domain-containing protein n=1 Tax=Spongiactinospora sp. 9N601 TaxID=3375149 RepID=UPI00379AF240